MDVLEIIPVKKRGDVIKYLAGPIIAAVIGPVGAKLQDMIACLM